MKKELPERCKTDSDAMDRLWDTLHRTRESSSTAKVGVVDLRNLLMDFSMLIDQFKEPNA
jgi:hypothetical protein